MEVDTLYRPASETLQDLRLPRTAARWQDLRDLAQRECWPLGEKMRFSLLEARAAAFDIIHCNFEQRPLLGKLSEELCVTHREFRREMTRMISRINTQYGDLSTVPLRMLIHDVGNAVHHLVQLLETADTLEQKDSAGLAFVRGLCNRMTEQKLLDRSSLSPEAFLDALAAPHVRDENTAVPPSSASRLAPLPDMIEQLFDEHRALIAGGEQVKCESKLAPTVLSEPLPYQFIVREVLGECIANAIRAMSSQGGLVGVVASVRNSGWHFLVTDTGPGMSADNFRLLEQGSFTTRKNGGSGIKLNKMAIEKLIGGSFKLRNVPGRGFAVRFTIPRESFESSISS